MQNQRLRSRMEALQKTGHSLEEQKIKRMCFMELKEDIQKAFHKDRAEINHSGLSSASSSSSLKDGWKPLRMLSSFTTLKEKDIKNPTRSLRYSLKD
ncbi:NPR1/NIM1-like, C-terminal [Dillenia turbinata]|uniref:NPR1/NIM1-like, C-terminal n=1 Tax=Dillenia turbinata TaxID=194707 RepID=A0AAN8VLM0_9MAGN